MDGEIVRTHLPCPDCGSSDALTEYTDGTYYFSCGRSPLGLYELDSGIMSDDEMEFHEINQLMAKKYKYSYRSVRR